MNNAPFNSARLILTVALGVLCSSCASTPTSMKSTWKAPDFKGGPVQKVAILAVSGRDTVRTALESRFANQLGSGGQPAVATMQILTLPEIKQSKEAAAARLREAGADSILITRLASKSSHVGEGREVAEYGLFVSTSPGENWHASFTRVYTDPRVPRAEDRDYYFLETSLYDLNTGNRLWSCLSEAVVKERADRLEIADALVASVVEQMRKDGAVR
jgi:hypothetical protein